MEGASVLSSSYSASSLHHQYSATTHLKLTSRHSCTSPSSLGKWQLFSITFLPRKRKNQAAVLSVSCPRATLRTSTFVLHKSSQNPTKDKDVMPKIDKSGRFCSPRAARELALMIIYAACLEGSDPVRLFEKRMNARREPGYEFRKELLLEYNHMNFGGSPVTTETLEEADNLIRIDEQESAIDAEVLSAPPKLVYSKLLLRFTRKLLVAVVDKWDSHVLVIDKIAPPVWKDDPAGRILEFCLLHLAMSEITVIETPRQIVINEAVDLAKRFCDGSAPRTINGCLRTFVNMKDESGHSGGTVAEPSDANQEVDV